MKLGFHDRISIHMIEEDSAHITHMNFSTKNMPCQQALAKTAQPNHLTICKARSTLQEVGDTEKD